MTYDHRQLRSFLAIVDRGSLNRAAQSLHMTQPTLSRLLAEMELKLGQRLFERSPKGMIPTQAGEVLIPHARLILHEMGVADDALGALGGLRRGTVRVGALATIARSILPHAVAQLLASSPGLSVSLLEQPDDRLTAALLQREIDVMITAMLPPTEGIAVIRECKYDDKISVFCAADHPLTKQSHVKLVDVFDQRWVMPARGATPRQLFDQLMAQLGQGVCDVVVETSSLEAMVSFVANSMLLGWLPLPLLSQALSAGIIKLLDIPELELRRRFFIYRRDRGIFPAPAKELLRFISPVSDSDD